MVKSWLLLETIDGCISDGIPTIDRWEISQINYLPTGSLAFCFPFACLDSHSCFYQCRIDYPPPFGLYDTASQQTKHKKKTRLFNICAGWKARSGSQHWWLLQKLGSKIVKSPVRNPVVASEERRRGKQPERKERSEVIRITRPAALDIEKFLIGWDLALVSVSFPLHWLYRCNIVQIATVPWAPHFEFALRLAKELAAAFGDLRYAF